MKKTLFIMLALCCTAFSSFAQNDSTAFANGNWTESRIDRKITFRQCYFKDSSIFNSNQCISVLYVKPCRKVDIISAKEGVLEPTTVLAEGATAAINGSFFNMSAPYGATTYTKVDGKKVGDNLEGRNKGNVRAERIGGVMLIKGKKVKLQKLDTDNLDYEDSLKCEDAMSGGPMLIVDGEYVPFKDVSFNTKRHPRTAVGLTKNGTKVFVTVDGRFPQSIGLSISELQQVMRWLGCVQALNMDGGGSTTMVVRGEIVNHPYDNKVFDNKGERKVQNAIVIK